MTSKSEHPLRARALVQPEKLLSLQSDYLTGHTPNFDKRVRASCEGGDTLLRTALEKTRPILVDKFLSKQLRKKVRTAIGTLVRATKAANKSTAESKITTEAALLAIGEANRAIKTANKRTADLIACIKKYGPPPEPSTLQEIANEVCARRGITNEELISKSFKRKFTSARDEFSFLANRHEGRGFPEIGRYLGGRHRTTIQNGVLKHIARMEGRA